MEGGDAAEGPAPPVWCAVRPAGSLPAPNPPPPVPRTQGATAEARGRLTGRCVHLWPVCVPPQRPAWAPSFHLRRPEPALTEWREVVPSLCPVPGGPRVLVSLHCGLFPVCLSCSQDAGCWTKGPPRAQEEHVTLFLTHVTYRDQDLGLGHDHLGTQFTNRARVFMCTGPAFEPRHRLAGATAAGAAPVLWCLALSV